MTRDWAAEWAREEQSVDDLLAMFTRARDCDHEFVPTEEVEGALSWVKEVCVKCGTTMGLKEAVDDDVSQS
jgi:hypothetical protein